MNKVSKHKTIAEKEKEIREMKKNIPLGFDHETGIPFDAKLERPKKTNLEKRKIRNEEENENKKEGKERKMIPLMRNETTVENLKKKKKHLIL